MDALVTTQWLADMLGAPDLSVLDASYTSTLPGSPAHDPRSTFEGGHIPGARFLDLDTLVDEADPRPSMLPPDEVVAERLAALGVGPEGRILLYDDSPHHTACRAWWVLRMSGIDASILDGGMDKWRAEGRPVEQGSPAPAQRGTTRGAPPLAAVRTKSEMLANLAGRAEQVVDCRSAARFSGEEVDPRPDCAAGHIPGAVNIPYGDFFRADGSWKSPAAIATLFEEAGIDLDRPIVASCGSGITAAVALFAAHLLGRDGALYDGSWSEWGADPDTPKALGAA